MIDLSDGLSRDLGHICDQSGAGAVLDASSIPIHTDVARLPPGPRTPLEHALHDGEDYELLFTGAAPPECGAIQIGRITREPGVWIDRDGNRERLEPRGWEH
jgi:thiamine-monophosphate kinase